MRYREPLENVNRRVKKWREKTRHLIGLRVCILCKYPFLSGKGANTCYDCVGEHLREWCRNKNTPITTIRQTRYVLIRAGYAQPTWRATVNPAIPIPPEVENDWHFKEAVKKTFETYQPYPLARRIIGWPPFPHLKFEGFDVGRPQEKVRRLK